ncbi:hypothetical protein [Spiroplasma endosymbiont of Phyllotreta cruciferae]|uniref:hypothetical protein n=1 Tax=Spiroplasma endosymbiont of Phyllotreta cruciferae TaxID=2886375 RepID=UPI0020A0FE68|nr:hypothetical protein [Spiroplasma endosymbiont of Phyllotreta cruciferae]
MKKLLSLLSILTISGTTAPTTIAASSYQKEETIKNGNINYSQSNNLEILNRNKRNNNELNIQLFDTLEHIARNRIIQQEPMWCGPATGELALRILGLNYWPQTRVNNRNYQQLLSTPNNMNTSSSIGTSPQNWVRAINGVINGNNLNNRRQYSITDWTRGYFNSNEFATLVRNSLENNVPVALASTGRLPQYQGERNRFYLITGIREDNDLNSLSRYSYQYFDPANGDFRTIREGNMYTLFGIGDIDYRRNMQNAETEFLRQGYSREELNRRGFTINDSNNPNNYYNYIISYNPNTSLETQIQRPNQTEPMDFSGQTCGYFQDCDAYLTHNIYSKNKHKH